MITSIINAVQSIRFAKLLSPRKFFFSASVMLVVVGFYMAWHVRGKYTPEHEETIPASKNRAIIHVGPTKVTTIIFILIRIENWSQYYVMSLTLIHR